MSPREHHRDRPHWVYRYFDEHGVLLYVGIAVNPEKRHLGHSADPWIKYVSDMQVGNLYPTKSDATDAERSSIKTERPIFNRMHADARQHMSAVEYMRSRGGDPDHYEQLLFRRVIGNVYATSEQVGEFVSVYQSGDIEAWRERMWPTPPPAPPKERQRPAIYDWPKREIKVEDKVWVAAQDAAYERHGSLRRVICRWLKRYASDAHTPTVNMRAAPGPLRLRHVRVPELIWADAEAKATLRDEGLGDALRDFLTRYARDEIRAARTATPTEETQP